MNQIRLDHVSVTCADLEASIRFYRDVVGLPLLDRGDLQGEELETLIDRAGARARWAELALGGGQVLELLQYVRPQDGSIEPRPWRAGATHIGLAVEELDPVLARVRASGARVSETVTLTEPGWEGVRCAYAGDPDGVSIELVERPGERVVVLPVAQEDVAAVTSAGEERVP